MQLVLRSASVSRSSGQWADDDYDVLAGERVVGRIYRIDSAVEIWWWGVSFHLIGRKGYGTAESREDALAACKIA